MCGWFQSQSFQIYLGLGVSGSSGFPGIMPAPVQKVLTPCLGPGHIGVVGPPDATLALSHLRVLHPHHLILAMRRAKTFLSPGLSQQTVPSA